MSDPRSRFIAASLWHGSLDEAQSILAAHPEIAGSDIHTAAILGDDAAVRRFLAEDPARATERGGPHGWDALTHLCFSRYLRLDPARSANFVRAATALLDAGASASTGFFDPTHKPEPAWESALYGAAGVAHHAELTKLLIERGADPNDDEVPYHAPETFDNAALRVLVESGTLNADSLVTLLLRKADWHDHDGIKYLLEHGADPNRVSRWSHTALQQAVRRDNALANIELMLDHGGNPTWRSPQDQASALSLAARRGRGDVIASCVKRRIALDWHGVERLIAACATNDASSVRDLAEAEPALVNELLAQGGTLLAEFAGVGNTDGVRHLLDLGVPVEARYESGDGYYGIAPNSTALHVAAWRARHGTVRLLIERGAAVDAVDGRGHTPLVLAVRACVDSFWSDRRSPESVEALLKAGASKRGVALPSGYAEVDKLLE